MWNDLAVDEREERIEESYVPTEPSTKEEIEKLVIMVRLELYNAAVSCGPQVIRDRMEKVYYANPLPSTRTIARILARNSLTHRRTGWYP